MDNKAFVLRMAAMYSSKSNDDDEIKDAVVFPRNKNGIGWYAVGHNSSHQFYLGVDENEKLLRRSFCYEEVLKPGMTWIEFHKLLASSDENDWKYAYSMLEGREEEFISEVTQGSLEYIGHW